MLSPLKIAELLDEQTIFKERGGGFFKKNYFLVRYCQLKNNTNKEQNISDTKPVKLQFIKLDIKLSILLYRYTNIIQLILVYHLY